MPILQWIGKEKVVNHHHDVPFKLLEHKYGFENGEASGNKTGSGNKIIHGDNLEALKALLPEYEGKIKCIYIDPPYNTGNESWVYNDNVNHPKIKKWLGEVVGKEGEDLTRHDKWLCMMYPRLKLLHKLLSEDGAIFISIDDNEQANLKLIMDEIFGLNNFIANIAVVNNFKGRSDDKYIATAHESLIIFQKGKFKTNGVPMPEEYLKEYNFSDEKGKYRLQGLRKRGSGASREDRPNMYYPFYFNKEQNFLSLARLTEADIVILPKLSDGSDGRWRWGKETANERINELEVNLVKGRNEYDIFQKDYLNKGENIKTIKPKSFWHGSEFSSEAGTLQLKKILGKGTFQTPKSYDFIQFCLHQATDQNSIILDSFAGSGTTAHAVLNLNKEDGGNRKFILIEMEDYAETITAERVKRVIKGYGENEGIPASFDYYELGKPLFIADKLNEDVEEEKIREYIFYTETGQALTNGGVRKGQPQGIAPTENLSFHPSPFTSHHPEGTDNKYFLNRFNDTSYYFIYEKTEITALDTDFLSTVKTKASQYIIYADNCLLSEEFMTTYNIIFKKIPRDITRI